MCGICGIVAFGRPPEVQTVERMSAELAHRGPDGVGSFAADDVAFGHRRLAIIDLSDAGIQPFASEDAELQLLHNGEIYNYRELRRELEGHGHRFRSQTDTEVVLRSYEQWGEACVERFNGMWALALWDGRRRRLFCSRDRFGVKPFYYSYRDGRFAFASELKAFRADATISLEPNLGAVRDYLEQGALDHTEETFFAGIRKLAPAHSLVLDANGVRTLRYWSLREHELPDDALGALRELFLDSIRLRLRSDVPIGTCLSGGLDSSAVACSVDHLLRTEVENARPVGDRQRTFTAFFEDEGYDERPYAEAVIGRTRAEPHWISFSADDVVEVLPAIVETQDEPFGSTSIVAQWFVMRSAREAGLKVMLDGQGGDEVLAGYPTYFAYRFADLARRGRFAELARELGAYRRLHGVAAGAALEALVRPLVPERLKMRARVRLKGAAGLAGPALAAAGQPVRTPPWAFPDHLRRRMQLILTQRGLPELLHYEDRNSMAHSLEARVPFLDYRLVELCYSLPPSLLIDRGITKVALRRALGDLLPPVVRDRVDKLGFVTPESRWLRERVGELAAEVFASREFHERGFVDPAVSTRRLEAHRAGSISAGYELWRALNLELWARTFLDPSGGGITPRRAVPASAGAGP
jgi:asparagine synthase (glutamine-hydrolysing)